jgi:hypothetical protein
MRLFQIWLESPALEDAFIYGTQLYCWTFDKKLRIYDVSSIERMLHAHHPEHGAAISYALFHSRGVGATPAMVDAWERAWTAPEKSDDRVTLDAERVPYASIAVDRAVVDVLDMMVFYNRLYLGTGAGLFTVEAFDRQEPPTRLRITPRIKQTCYAVSGGLGAVAASCGDKGLYLLLDITAEARRSPKAASQSLRSEIGYGTVANHRSRDDVELLAGETVDTDRGRVLTGVRRPRAGASASRQVAQDLGGGIDLTLWDQSRLVVFRAGAVSSVGVARSGDVRALGRTRELATYGERLTPLSAARVGHHFAMETDEAVVVAGDAGTGVVQTGPVISLRTYPRSVRYRRLVTATSESGLWLVGVAEEPDWLAYG